MSDSASEGNKKLYDAFVSALEREIGPIESGVNHALVGFEFGGPPDILFFRNAPGIKGTYYVTSDLLFFERQPKNSLGRYELAICLLEESKWAEKILYKFSQATIDEVFDHGHTADITAWVDPNCPIKGLLLTKLISFEHGGQAFGALLCLGITREELDYALKHGKADLLKVLKSSGVFPITDLLRKSIV